VDNPRGKFRLGGPKTAGGDNVGRRHESSGFEDMPRAEQVDVVPIVGFVSAPADSNAPRW